MEIPRPILERLKHNEEIANKFHEIEIRVLSVLEFKAFFDQLLWEISDKFSIPHIWFSIIEESDLAKQLADHIAPDRLTASVAFVPAQTFLSIIQNQQKPLLNNSDLESFQPLFPAVPDYTIGSIAIAPISLDGEIVGSINQADPDPKRFNPGIDTSLLERLALKVSLCLSNVSAHEKLKFMAYHDPLTGLLNRRVMEEILGREFRRAQRYETDLSLIFLDLDDFKIINDTAGHDIGDQALCRAAKTLDTMKRDSDVVSRFAGDEFVVILPLTGRDQAETYIQRVKRSLDEAPLKVDSHQFIIKMSHGIATITDQGMTDPQALLKAADNALYMVKQKKKSRKAS